MERVREYWHYLLFRGVMLSIDVAFWTSKVRQWVRRMSRKPNIGFEEELEKTMRDIAKSTFGVNVPPGAFDG